MRSWRVTRLVLIIALVGAGCVSLPANPSSMTPEQLREWVKDKSANVLCSTIATPYKGTVIVMNLDKGVVVNGAVTIKDGCEVTITNTAPGPRTP